MHAAGRPSLALKAVLALVVSGLLVAVLLPLLAARGVTMGPWGAWGLVGGVLALFTGPELYDRWKRAREAGRLRAR